MSLNKYMPYTAGRDSKQREELKMSVLTITLKAVTYVDTLKLSCTVYYWGIHGSTGRAAVQTNTLLHQKVQM